MNDHVENNIFLPNTSGLCHGTKVQLPSLTTAEITARRQYRRILQMVILSVCVAAWAWMKSGVNTGFYI
ncbi:hypothetical protein ACJ5NV_10945 [Loktanella agnita]|uniref:hypothetical protein n=1 Tax=Loktanella agnita TaxID=287097 RepID=UPI0039867677